MAQRYRFTRDFFIPKGSRKVADKLSSAVVYLYERGPAFLVMAFHGKAQKPDFHYRYASARQREARVLEFFQAWRKIEGRRADQRAEYLARQGTLQVGDILNTCWGYEQTNREFFEVIEIRGKHAILREIAQERTEDAWHSGKCRPLPGSYIGEPIRRLVKGDAVKIDECRRAWKWNKTTIAGVPMGDTLTWSATH